MAALFNITPHNMNANDIMKLKYILVGLLLLIILLGAAYIHQTKRQSSAIYPALKFTLPDQSTPELTLRTFWWAIKTNQEAIALNCVDQGKVSEGYHGRDTKKFISDFSNLDTADFKFIANETGMSIKSPHHNMDYDMEKGKTGQWVIISIHP